MFEEKVWWVVAKEESDLKIQQILSGHQVKWTRTEAPIVHRQAACSPIFPGLPVIENVPVRGYMLLTDDRTWNQASTELKKVLGVTKEVRF